MMWYTIEEIVQMAGVSKTSVYNHFGKNREFVNKNSKRKQRKVYYNEDVKSWIQEYYRENEVVEDQLQNQITLDDLLQDGAKIALPQIDEMRKQLEMARKQVDRLTEENARLREVIEKKEKQIDGLISQNGQVLLALQMEKQESIKLLCEIRKPWYTKIFGIEPKKKKEG